MATELALTLGLNDRDLANAVERGQRARWWRRCGSKRAGFWYQDAQGRRVTDAAALERIRSLVIPPAWEHVRISPAAGSCMQAVGVDTSGRIQYSYSPVFCARQQKKKYAKIERFGEKLPLLRRLTNEHLVRAERNVGRERVLAVVVRLINDLYFRVGSETSVKRYRTYGVTTLRNRHIEIKDDGQLVFSFVGKHQVKHRRIVVDKQLAELMREIKAVGGAKLFEYVGDDGRVRAVTPRDVNSYIKSATSGEFSAKDFRTWGATLLAAVYLAEEGPAESERDAKRKVARVVKRVAERLGNTPTVCKNSYIHPSVFDRYAAGVTLDQFRSKADRRVRRDQPEYEVEELALLRLLRAQVARASRTGAARRAA